MYNGIINPVQLLYDYQYVYYQGYILKYIERVSNSCYMHCIHKLSVIVVTFSYVAIATYVNSCIDR